MYRCDGDSGGCTVYAANGCCALNALGAGARAETEAETEAGATAGAAAGAGAAKAWMPVPVSQPFEFPAANPCVRAGDAACAGLWGDNPPACAIIVNACAREG